MALTKVSTALFVLFVYDFALLIVLLAIVTLMSRTKRAAYAVMKRNFKGYFSNPTGYVFLCIFVFLTSLAAFWPYEFFNQNLATLDQLNYWFPLIMLVFIPAITMSIWAEEKRQGTDELLLTLPADDFDIVIGKYMSAAAIFTSSLLFSQLSTFVTLAILSEGQLDIGLIFTTYLGYWFVGLSMIAIGMIASFLTGNLTVGFILGSLFNAPLAFASLADSVSPNQQIAAWIASAGIARPFDDFGRGIISTSSVFYFSLVGSVALYACMVLIGRRHWTGGKDGNTMAWHYLSRVIALTVLTISLVVTFRARDSVRLDTTEGQVSSLAPATKKLIRELDSDQPIVIDAFVSTEIPEIYARTRYKLINLLKEFRSEAAKGGRKLEVNLYQDIELFSEDAALAEERFGITPVARTVREKGTQKQKQFILGAAFRSGLEKVTVPIFEYGIPVEYELVRSINTVASGKRKRIGIVQTDALMMGGYVLNQTGNRVAIQRHVLVEELARQYEVESVDLSGPITVGSYDALLAVQPSSLEPARFQRLVEAIGNGIPAAIFEDPVPQTPYIPGTASPKMVASPQGGQAPSGMGKADIRDLWDVLQLQVPGRAALQGIYEPDLVWQFYNPYPTLQEEGLNQLAVFIDENAPGISEGQALNAQSVITSGMNEVLTLYTGAVGAKEDSTLTHTPLLTTGDQSGLISLSSLVDISRGRSQLNQEMNQPTPYLSIAMSIEGQPPQQQTPSAATTDEAPSNQTDPSDKTGPNNSDSIRAVYVADTDLMLPQFSAIRADPDSLTEVRYQFQNVTFVLNCVDWVAGETDFIEIRKHQPIFASLTMIDAVKQEAITQVRQQSNAFQQEFEIADRDALESQDRRLQKLREEIEKLQQDKVDDQAELQAKQQKFQTQQALEQRRLEVKRTKMARERNMKVREIERRAAEQVTKIQNQVKVSAVAVPCIPPLVVGIIVFASRRLRERESISSSRLK
ncbi:Gldg family protein [bacterium]|nr:Gldg family protein [bacterium]MDC0278570.1 Gldg family protein [bacterium]